MEMNYVTKAVTSRRIVGLTAASEDSRLNSPPRGGIVIVCEHMLFTRPRWNLKKKEEEEKKKSKRSLPWE